MAEARRKTTIDECKEIVEYCINHTCNNKDTATLFDFSYNQVMNWNDLDVKILVLNANLKKGTC